MGIFSQQPRKEDGVKAAPKLDPEPARIAPPPPPPARNREDQLMAVSKPNSTESILASGLTIEGKVEGDGNVRMAGRFKGHVDVKGEVTIEPGASVEGELIADTVLVGGEVRGQVQASSRVDLKESGSLIGDLKAGSLTVAAGSKMRGKVEFGWKEGEIENVKQTELRLGKAQ